MSNKRWYSAYLSKLSVAFFEEFFLKQQSSPRLNARNVASSFRFRQDDQQRRTCHGYGAIHRVSSTNCAHFEMLTVRRSLRGDLIKIHVGALCEISTPFVVPKSLLTRFPYFEKALSSSFKEGKAGVFYFPEDGEEAWKHLIYFIFHEKIEPLGIGEKALWSQFLTLTHAYLLGDKYQLGRFQNQIVHTLVTAFRTLRLNSIR